MIEMRASAAIDLGAAHDAWQSSSVAGNVINLNRFRKKKAREDKAKQAEINRIRHGRTQVEKDRERIEKERAARLIDGKRLDQDTTPAAQETDDSDEPEAP